MTYQETIDYLYSQLPMFSKQGALAIKKDLHNTIALCEALGNPHQQFKSIHIAGTNGKGSSSHMLAAVLQSAGYSTGLYTSPHLQDFRERIKINGRMVEESFVVAFTEKVKPLIASIQPSFFEITVAMAFSWFAENRVDIAVIETGLGGRLDSTNIINPELSLVTNIGWDHMNLLGNTLDQIAFEKAGIIKKGIPVVISEVLPETLPVFKKAAHDREAPLYLAQETQQLLNWEYRDHKLFVQVRSGHHQDAQTYQLDLPGAYQARNIRGVLQAIHILQEKGWNIPEKAIHQGLASARKITGLHGRWEVVGHHPTMVLDVGHNEDGVRAILNQLELCTYTRLHIVIGMVKDKEIDKVLSLLPKRAHYYFTQASIPRALPASDLQEKARLAGLEGQAYPKVMDAVKAAREAASGEDMILVCGSVFVVGEATV
ncbi:bifunctional folylpolyglutamate synthase/dihydrofolate synthase [Flavihumibacter rivuli]|uniref:bifunctional folylpolyglutamate synthase/dihydrofolate synthase n=1 Tax=Flavihumibacter rivuli TaxID=2838156 RepID=UPI001BDEC924|nr:folylpolyglutamate synthase/dihydrofolate synthase family protein [Flavihumibacter rivuli]ULQ57822.1 bifunctional folylpolyglutamate synthase/dihydrofolate synthase [Flavihumibacter rivuli]